MRVTIRDIAKSLNLSHTTISRALSDREDAFISDSTRQRVQEAAREMGYRPNHVARALVTGRTHIIAFWVSLAPPYFAKAIQHCQRLLKQDRFDMFVHEMPEVPCSPQNVEGPSDGSRLSHWPVDGIIALDCASAVEAFLDAHPASHSPIVSVGHYHVERTDHVGVDLYSGALAAIRHLVEVTDGRVAYCVQSSFDKAGDARRDAYATVMEEAGRWPEYIVSPDNKRAETRQCVREYVREHGCPEGIFCFNDDMAIGTYRALCDMGVRVPDDVALIGCDGIEDTEYLERPISTVVQPVEQMCRLAWQFLQARINDPSAPLQRALLQPELVIRESSCRIGGACMNTAVVNANGRE